LFLPFFASVTIAPNALPSLLVLITIMPGGPRGTTQYSPRPYPFSNTIYDLCGVKINVQKFDHKFTKLWVPIVKSLLRLLIFKNYFRVKSFFLGGGPKIPYLFSLIFDIKNEKKKKNQMGRWMNEWIWFFISFKTGKKVWSWVSQ
jgi:hypothetical protein